MKKVVKKSSKKVTNKQDYPLIVTFVFLILLVIILAIVALNIDKINKSTTSNITIPILEENSQNEISVDISDMKNNETKEYIFNVTNYKAYETNEEEIKYSIDIISPDNAQVELYKNNSDDNLLKNDNFKATNNKLTANKKKEDEYKLIIKCISSSAETEKITIKINS